MSGESPARARVAPMARPPRPESSTTREWFDQLAGSRFAQAGRPSTEDRDVPRRVRGDRPDRRRVTGPRSRSAASLAEVARRSSSRRCRPALDRRAPPLLCSDLVGDPGPVSPAPDLRPRSGVGSARRPGRGRARSRLRGPGRPGPGRPGPGLTDPADSARSPRGPAGGPLGRVPRSDRMQADTPALPDPLGSPLVVAVPRGPAARPDRRLDRRSPVRRILDAGCGDGLFFDRLARFGRVEGLEPDASLLADPRGGPRSGSGRSAPSFRPDEPYRPGPDARRPGAHRGRPRGPPGRPGRPSDRAGTCC